MFWIREGRALRTVVVVRAEGGGRDHWEGFRVGFLEEVLCLS